MNIQYIHTVLHYLYSTSHEFSHCSEIRISISRRNTSSQLIFFINYNNDFELLFQTIKAQRAVTEMRGRYFKGNKLQIDYASHEFRAAFFEQCRNSGMDMKERSKPWETQQPPQHPVASAIITASATSADNSNSPDSSLYNK